MNLPRQTDILLSILKSATQPMTTRQIWIAMEPGEQGRFVNCQAVGKCLDGLLRRKSIETGPMARDGANTVKTWKMKKTMADLLKNLPDKNGLPAEPVDLAVAESDIDYIDDLLPVAAEDRRLLVMKFDPQDPLENSFYLFAQALKNVDRDIQAVKIKNKSQKIQTLKNLIDFPFLDKSYLNVLSSIADDLELLEAED